MRILQVSCVCAPLHPAGVANLVHRLSRKLVIAGHRVTVFTLTETRRRPYGELVHKDIDGFRVAALNQPVNGFSARYRVEDYLNPAAHEPFRKVVQEFAPDVIHFHAIQGIGAGLLDWVPRGIPTVLMVHDYWWICPNLFLSHLDGTLCTRRSPNPKSCERCLSTLSLQARFGLDEIEHRWQYLNKQLRKFTRILAVSRHLRDRLAGFLPDIEIGVCENGIEWKPAIARAVDRRTRNHRPLKTIGFVGGANPLKGFWCLLDAVERVPNSNVRVHVYGCPSLPWRIRLGQAFRTRRSAGRKPGLKRGRPDFSDVDPRVFLKPAFAQRSRYKVYASFDLLIIPSIVHESFSLVCREALVTGVPVIAARCGGPEEVIRHESNGLLFAAGNDKELAACISRCLDEPGLLESLQANADSRGIRTLSEQLDQLLQEYETLIAGKAC